MAETTIILSYPYMLLSLILIVPVLVIVKKVYRVKKQLVSKIYYRGSRHSLFLVFKIVSLILLCLALTEPIMITYSKVLIDSPNALYKYSGELPINYIVLVDVSPSMHRTHVLEQAVKIVEQIIDSLNESDHLILAIFGGIVEKVYEGPPHNGSYVLPLISNRTILYTSIADALAWALSYSRASKKPSATIILSDGANNYGGDPVDTAIVLNQSGVPVLFINVGNDPRGVKLYSRLITRGFHVVDASNLEIDELKNLVKGLMYEVKFEALQGRGQVYVIVRSRSYLPTHLLIVSSLIVFIVSRLEGV